MGGRSRGAGRARIVSILALSALVSGCSSSEGGPAESAEAQPVDSNLIIGMADRYGYEVESATQTPVFALVPEYRDPRDMYARMLLARQCMAGLLVYQVEPPRPSTATDVFDARSGDKRFNEQIAAQWGYQAPPIDPSTRTTEVDGASSDVIDAKREECGARAQERLGNPPAAPLSRIVTAGWDALEVNDAVTELAAEWRDCMAPAGVIDLPDSPVGMPSQSVAPTTEGAAPSTRQREVAVLDAQCREQVGYPSAVLRARAEGELSAIGRDPEGFDSARLKYQEYAKGIDQVIQEMG